MNIRHATMDDLLDVFHLAKTMNAETIHYAGFDFDDEKSMAYLIEHVNHPSRMLTVAEGNDGEVVGFMLASATTTFFGNDVVTRDDAFYVLPGHRGQGALKGFLLTYQQWAATQNPKFVHIGVSQGINDERTVASLQKAGFEPFGTLLRRAG